ncbi:MAG: D-alanyl-D-alanine carboxypeptidase [Clostridia bacterium]|nr:D-alanyl-D-alanine carboxypeptidase [Clostridia bacterium]
MSKPQLTEKEKRRRRYRRRRRIVMLVGVLILAALVALLVWLISLVGGLIRGNAPAAPAEQPAPVTTTTTYPTLPAAEVASQLHMNSVLLYDETHDTVLYQANADTPAYPASLTKMLTAAVAARYCPADTVFYLDTEQALVEWDASTAYLQPDTPYSLPAMLDALLLPSGADAAYCLAANTARIHSGNADLSDTEAVETFIGYMNHIADELGCTHSHFVTPDGYHRDDHYSTAADMLKIARYAYSFDLIRQSVSRVHSDYGDWYNSNYLIRSDDPNYYYPYATGFKTGYTDEAGFCLAATAEKDGVRLFAILLGSDSTEYRFLDAAALFERGFDLAYQQTTTTFSDYLQFFTTQTTCAPR